MTNLCACRAAIHPECYEKMLVFCPEKRCTICLEPFPDVTPPISTSCPRACFVVSLNIVLCVVWVHILVSCLFFVVETASLFFLLALIVSSVTSCFLVVIVAARNAQCWEGFCSVWERGSFVRYTREGMLF